ncbi:MAG: CTP synthase [candidate division WS1 bacterium]|jgi:CTP synthase|nr:CTP synthase [candidate division WS1 bacterium]
MTKYCFVTGGVVSGIGKGITAASLGRLLKARGHRIAIVKVDPYINVDAGLMNPFQHGEVFVTDDGAETDLDLGHYERFVDEPLSQLSNVTTGQVYGSVIAKERDGDYYLGQTVQVIPHITDEIKSRIRKCANAYEADICIVEVGGTVGDIEGQPFYEAIRQMRIEEGRENSCYMHVTLVPYLPTVGELKTKPTQHSVRELRSIGIQPDLLVVRTARPLGREVRRKLSLFCDVPTEAVIEAVDVRESLYHIPLAMERQQMAELVCRALHLPERTPDLSEWQEICDRYAHPESEVTIAMVGKYMELQDAYLSVTEALMHGGIANSARVNIKYVDSESVEQQGPAALLSDVQGVLVPGGFGDRGIEGKIAAIGFARENNIPYLGLCLGLQTAVIDFARNVCGLEDANSREFNEDCKNPVIIYLKEQEYITELGGTMRLGAYPCVLEPGSLAARLYETEEISERHRHRLEVNNEYRDTLCQNGLVCSGTSPEGDLVEMVEIPEHPFFIASQFHPEFKSRPNRAHPLFRGFIEAALKHSAG